MKLTATAEIITKISVANYNISEITIPSTVDGQKIDNFSSFYHTWNDQSQTKNKSDYSCHNKVYLFIGVLS